MKTGLALLITLVMGVVLISGMVGVAVVVIGNGQPFAESMAPMAVFLAGVDGALILRAYQVLCGVIRGWLECRPLTVYRPRPVDELREELGI